MITGHFAINDNHAARRGDHFDVQGVDHTVVSTPEELAADIPVAHNSPCIDDETARLCWFHSDLGNTGENS